MNNVKLEDCELITNNQYMNLIDPEFVGQTRINKDNIYYMCWKSEGKLYKTKNKL